ncbi:hypothetical protein E4191_19455 (plasmid) [Paracoccus liaowanqingii]|uniref:Uncharacterized protein n=1 Tax=Paracoccus liaowanqingii TaxID=2560053 RepID=A0A4Y5SSK7_9RHOB|nr:hypothetical protein [Paracoccus liaowanqingii]QDA36289.1 hypothetical protein E4191_19455 [Paracoccus liaowanqingii]
MTELRMGNNRDRHAINNKSALFSRRGFLYGTAAVTVGTLITSGLAQASELNSFSMRVVHSGHSLTDPIVPVLDMMVAAAGQQEARSRVIDRSTTPGSPMDWRWDHRNEYMPDARHDIADYDTLVLTERAPLSNTVQWHDSENMALKWFSHAWNEGNKGAGARTILYATWVHTDSGPDFDNPYDDPDGHLTFRERLPLEMERWQITADEVNENRPDGSAPLRVIPGPLIMAAAHDAIAAGTAPGLNEIEDLFLDTIHLNAQGSYLIALAHLAVIYGFDPRNLTNFPVRVEVPDPATADWMKQLVHDVLKDYPDAAYATS